MSIDIDRIGKSIKEYIKGCRARILCGFDGYVDTLVRLQRSLKGDGYFETVEEFASFITRERDQSSDIPVRKTLVHHGGNAPLFGYSAAEKHMEVRLVGALGLPEINRCFSTHDNIRMYSLAEPAETYAFEFMNGKIMLGDVGPLNGINYGTILDIMGAEELLRIFSLSRAVLFSNWSGLLNSNDILEGICRDIVPKLEGRERIFMFDLADPSGRSRQEFDELRRYMGILSGRFETVLGLNEKEYRILYGMTFSEIPEPSPESIRKLCRTLAISEAVVHGLDYSIAASADGSGERINGRLVREPAIVTGGGDNFNAGYMLGKVCGLSAPECAYLGNVSSYVYVKYGHPAGIEDILEEINEEQGVLK